MAKRFPSEEQDKLEDLERRTWNTAGSHNINWLCKAWEDYTDEELTKQRDRLGRPRLEDISAVFYAVARGWDGKVTDTKHWVRQTKTCTLNSLFLLEGHRYTAKELWWIWLAMPMVQHPAQRDMVPTTKKASLANFIAGREALFDAMKTWPALPGKCH